MKKLLLFTYLFLAISCDKDKTTLLSDNLDPLTFIPANYTLIVNVQMQEALKIPGLTSRIAHEVKRKPSLQLFPVENIKEIYLTAGSVAEVETKGALYLTHLLQPALLEECIRQLQEKFKDNKDVIFSKKEYNSKIIHLIRDKKQEIAICQISPSIFLHAPLEILINSLETKENNIANNVSLNELKLVNPTDPIKVFALSGNNLGAILQQLNFFQKIILTAKPTEKGGQIYLKAVCENKEMAEKGKNTFLLLQTIFAFKAGNHLSSKDISISVNDHITTVHADLQAEALKTILEKK